MKIAKIKSDSIARRLILVKDAIFKAQQLVSHTNVDLNLMLAVWQADFALELAFPAFFDQQSWAHPPPKGLRAPGLPEFLEVFEKNHIIGNLHFVHLISLARKIHDARNKIQHQGVIFSQSTSSEYVYNAKSILEELSSQYLGVNLDRINLSLLNTDLDAQKYFDEALEHSTKGDYDDAARSIAKAYKIAYSNLLKSICISQETSNYYLKSQRRQPLKQKIEKILSSASLDSFLRDSYLEKAISALIEPIGLIQFGIDLDIAVRFYNLLPGVVQPADSTDWVHYGSHENYLLEDIEFLFDQSLHILHRMRINLESKS
jgi:hypothetical protein